MMYYQSVNFSLRFFVNKLLVFRMPKHFMNAQPSKSDRPSIVKDTDLKDLDNINDDDIGWDAAQDEVDYNAKLKFDESDESDDDNKETKKTGERNDKEKVNICFINSVSGNL